MVDFSRPKFRLGQVLATPAALDALAESGQTYHEFLRRHASHDWGELCSGDEKLLNDLALGDGRRLHSAYRTNEGQELWVITEAADHRGRRRATTLLLPSDY